MKHRTLFLIVSAFILILFQREVSAQSIPLMIPHSGTVSVNGAPFNGNGLFKFAIVNDTGTVSWWTNDNTHLDGTEPDAAVTIPVTNGAFSVKLGDTNQGMVAIQTALFTNNSVAFLRIWFSDGVTGFQQLSPDRQLVSVPYAYKAETAETANGLAGTDVLTIPGIIFRPNNNTTTFGPCFPQSITWTGTGSTQFFAGVNLPNNVTVTEFAVLWWDVSGTSDVTATLFRLDPTNTSANSPVSLATASSSGNTGIHGITVTTSISNAIIDNVTFQYYVLANLPGASGSMCIDGVRIKYTRNP